MIWEELGRVCINMHLTRFERNVMWNRVAGKAFALRHLWGGVSGRAGAATHG